MCSCPSCSQTEACPRCHPSRVTKQSYPALQEGTWEFRTLHLRAHVLLFSHSLRQKSLALQSTMCMPESDFSGVILGYMYGVWCGAGTWATL